jgi:glutathione S-transferase
MDMRAPQTNDFDAHTGGWHYASALARQSKGPAAMTEAILTISSRNYSSWSLRGWLLARMSGLPFEVKVLAADDAAALDELMLRSSSILVPSLLHDGISVWDTLAIAEYLNEVCPQAGMFPADRAARARCRSISGEMHSGFGSLRSALPMNLRAHRTGFRILSAARMDIERILTIWRECLAEWKGPWLFGERRCVADAMYGAGGHPAIDLRCESRPGVRGLLRPYHGSTRHAGMDRPCEG